MATGLINDTARFADAVACYAGRRGVVVSALVGLGALLEGVGIVLLVPLLATLFGQGAATSLPSWLNWPMRLFPDTTTTGRLAAILLIFGAIMVLRAVILWARDQGLGRLQVGFIAHQRTAIARALARAEWPVLARLGHARVNHLMGGDIQRCGAGVHFLLQSGIALVMMVVQAVIAFLLAPLVTLMAVGLMVAGAFALSGLLRRSQDAGRAVTEANQTLMEGLGRFLGGVKMAMSQNLQNAFVREFEHSIQRSADLQTGFAGQQAALRGLWSLLAAGVAGTAVLAGYALFAISPAILLALLVLLSRIAAPAAQLHLGLQQIAYCLPAWQEIEAIKADLGAVAVNQKGLAKISVPASGDIDIREVTYSHGDGRLALDDITFGIKAGEIIGISGVSGAGKTTFVDLLTGLIDPQSGAILIGGVDLAKADKAGWQDRIAYIAQDPVLFNDSVRGNLAWMVPEATDTKMVEMLTFTGADQWLARLPNGLDTMMGEKGTLISGGERQRLAIARALLRQPALLILDEATSAIDIGGERRILNRLAALDPRPTIIIIAHRAESLALCDHVVTLTDGQIVYGAL